MFLVSGFRSLSLRIIAYNIVVCVLWGAAPVAAKAAGFHVAPPGKSRLTSVHYISYGA